MDYLSIGSVPYNEDCAQMGTENYYSNTKIECRAFINQLVRELGEPPVGAYFKIQGFPHDFGTYYEVVCRYDENNEDALDYAFNAEGHSPGNWDEIALAELKENGYTLIKEPA